MIPRILAWLLGKNLSEKARTILLNAVINSIQAVPIRSIITTDENRRILINGKPTSIEQLQSLQASAYSALNNQASNLIDEQVRFVAIDKGFLQSDDPRTALFYKAALWFAQERKELLKTMAGNQDPTL